MDVKAKSRCRVLGTQCSEVKLGGCGAGKRVQRGQGGRDQGPTVTESQESTGVGGHGSSTIRQGRPGGDHLACPRWPHDGDLGKELEVWLEGFEEVREEVRAAGTSESPEVGWQLEVEWGSAMSRGGHWQVQPWPRAQMLDAQGWERRRTMTSCGRRQLGQHPGSPLLGAAVFSVKEAEDVCC